MNQTRKKMSKMASTVENLEQQLRDLLQSAEQLREEQLFLWEQQSQYRTQDYVQEMMRITQAIVDNFEKREEVCKKIEEAEHRVQKTVPTLSNNAAGHASLQQLNSKFADIILSEAERLCNEANILKDQLNEAKKQRRAILDWKENYREELNALSRRNSYRRQVQQHYFLAENKVCRLQKAYDRKLEEFERAYAEVEALNSNSALVKSSDSNSNTYSKHVSSSDSDIILLDKEATIEIENKLGAEEASEAHIPPEQTQDEESSKQITSSIYSSHVESSTTAEIINNSRLCDEQDQSQDSETVVLKTEQEVDVFTEQADIQAVQDVNHSWNPDMNDNQEIQFSEVVEQQAQPSADTITCTQNEPSEDRQLDISDYQNVNQAELNSS